MAIEFACGGCATKYKVGDQSAGKRGKCPKCGAVFVVPKPRPQNAEEDDDDEYRLAEEPPPTRPAPVAIPARPANAPRPPVRPAVAISPPTPAPAARPALAALPITAPTIAALAKPRALGADAAGWVPQSQSDTPEWLRHLHWLLLLAMVPLAVSTLFPDDVQARFFETIKELSDAEETAAAANPTSSDASGAPQPAPAPGPTAQPASAVGEDDEDASEVGPPDIQSLVRMLPNQRIKGALLPVGSYVPWFFALVTIVAYMLFFCFLAYDNSAKPLHLLGVGLFTATIGVALLVIVQILATLGLRGGIRIRGIFGLVLLVLILLGASYALANNPEVNFVGSFFGFTCGVGLCEELCKALPILAYFSVADRMNWRGAFLWGLASGAGFGVAEGILYSSSFYNGICGPGVYVVRFVSCVALHAVWAGSVGIAAHNNQEAWREDGDEDASWMRIFIALKIIAVPMVLHGLYDTLLKKDMELLALATAAASFGWLAFQISRLRTVDDEATRAAFVRSYIKSREAGT